MFTGTCNIGGVTGLLNIIKLGVLIPDVFFDSSEVLLLS